MQITLKDRAALTGSVTVRSRHVDVSNIPLLSMALVIHSGTGGSGTRLDIDMETSDDLETWVGVGSSFGDNAPGRTTQAWRARTTPWGRYVRASIALSGPSPQATFSLWLYSYPSR